MSRQPELLRVVEPDLDRLTEDMLHAIIACDVHDLRPSLELAQVISRRLIRAERERDALRAENERLRNAVRKLLACPAIADGNHNEPAYYDAETVEAEREGRSALERKPE